MSLPIRANAQGDTAWVEQGELEAILSPLACEGKKMNIKTRWHKLCDVSGHVLDNHDGLSILHYVITDDVAEILNRMDIQKMLHGMDQANIVNLPADAVIIETPGDEYTSFCLVQMSLAARAVIDKSGEEFEGHGFHFTTAYLANDERWFTVFRDDKKDKSHFNGVLANDQSGVMRLGLTKDIDKRDRFTAFHALMCAMLLVNTRGITKEIIEPTRLNKKRKQSSKPPIPRHTVLHIGTVYSRNGQATPYNEGTRKTMVVHWRAGYIRQQPYGPNRSLRKPKWIEPTLVNYDPESGEMPEVKPRIVVR